MVKLHHYFGHCHPEKLKNLIKRAGRWSKSSEIHLQKIKKCKICQVYSSKVSKPKVALPRATGVNQVVTIDLRHSRCEKSGAYILYIIDAFSRFRMGHFIPNKSAVTVVDKIISTWIRILGPMDLIHSDQGGEFLN